MGEIKTDPTILIFAEEIDPGKIMYFFFLDGAAIPSNFCQAFSRKNSGQIGFNAEGVCQ